MKKIFLFLAVCGAVMAVSCNKQSSMEKGEKIIVTVQIRGEGSPETKSVGNSAANEGKVNNLQVFAFNNGNLEDYGTGSSTDVSKAVLNATTGSREIWAVVNAPDLSSIRTLTELKASTSLLAENALDNFVMIGSTVHELSNLNDESNPIEIVVKRVVSKVSLLKVSADFQLTMSNAHFDLKKVYLINVVGSQLYSIGADGAWVASPATWLNQLGYVASGADALLYDVVSTSTDITNTNASTVQHDFYPYPNALGQARDSQNANFPRVDGSNIYSVPWSPRQTMLVLEGQFYEGPGDATGVLGYYSIDLPALERNKVYIIEEVVLKRRPSDTPYDPIMTGQSYVSISVHGWETGLNLGTIVC